MADFEKSVVGIIKDGRMASMFQLKEMAERVEGKVTQSLEVKTELRDMTEAELQAKLELLRKELAEHRGHHPGD
jgi:predicted nuclease with TOPRIM domain